jgi:hypothetical protein
MLPIVAYNLFKRCYLDGTRRYILIWRIDTCKCGVQWGLWCYRMHDIRAVPWLRRLVAGLSAWRPGFDPDRDLWWINWHLDRFLPPVLRFYPVSFIPPVLHYLEKRKKLMLIITGLHNKPQGCGASVASAAGPLTTKKFDMTCKHVKCRELLGLFD